MLRRLVVDPILELKDVWKAYSASQQALIESKETQSSLSETMQSLEAEVTQYKEYYRIVEGRLQMTKHALRAKQEEMDEMLRVKSAEMEVALRAKSLEIEALKAKSAEMEGALALEKQKAEADLRSFIDDCAKQVALEHESGFKKAVRQCYGFCQVPPNFHFEVTKDFFGSKFLSYDEVDEDMEPDAEAPNQNDTDENTLNPQAHVPEAPAREDGEEGN